MFIPTNYVRRGVLTEKSEDIFLGDNKKRGYNLKTLFISKNLYLVNGHCSENAGELDLKLCSWTTPSKKNLPNAYTIVSTVAVADPSGGVRRTVWWLKIKAHICRHCHPAGTWAGPYTPRVGVSSYSAASVNCKTQTIKNKCSSSAKRLQTKNRHF